MHSPTGKKSSSRGTRLPSSACSTSWPWEAKIHYMKAMERRNWTKPVKHARRSWTSKQFSRELTEGIKPKGQAIKNVGTTTLTITSSKHHKWTGTHYLLKFLQYLVRQLLVEVTLAVRIYCKLLQASMFPNRFAHVHIQPGEWPWPDEAPDPHSQLPGPGEKTKRVQPAECLWKCHTINVSKFPIFPNVASFPSSHHFGTSAQNDTILIYLYIYIYIWYMRIYIYI